MVTSVKALWWRSGVTVAGWAGGLLRQYRFAVEEPAQGADHPGAVAQAGAADVFRHEVRCGQFCCQLGADARLNQVVLGGDATADEEGFRGKQVDGGQQAVGEGAEHLFQGAGGVGVARAQALKEGSAVDGFAAASGVGGEQGGGGGGLFEAAAIAQGADADFARGVVGAAPQFAFKEDGATEAGAEGEAEGGAAVLCRTQPVFAECHGIDVVFDAAWQSALVFDEGFQGGAEVAGDAGAGVQDGAAVGVDDTGAGDGDALQRGLCLGVAADLHDLFANVVVVGADGGFLVGEGLGAAAVCLVEGGLDFAAADVEGEDGHVGSLLRCRAR